MDANAKWREFSYLIVRRPKETKESDTEESCDVNNFVSMGLCWPVGTGNSIWKCHLRDIYSRKLAA